mgnify:CR=1 FL=1|jgi:hypothetical protein
MKPISCLKIVLVLFLTGCAGQRDVVVDNPVPKIVLELVAKQLSQEVAFPQFLEITTEQYENLQVYTGCSLGLHPTYEPADEAIVNATHSQVKVWLEKNIQRDSQFHAFTAQKSAGMAAYLFTRGQFHENTKIPTLEEVARMHRMTITELKMAEKFFENTLLPLRTVPAKTQP